MNRIRILKFFVTVFLLSVTLLANVGVAATINQESLDNTITT